MTRNINMLTLLISTENCGITWIFFIIIIIIIIIIITCIKSTSKAPIQGGAKTGPAYLIANIMKTPWPNCVEIGELLQCEYAEHSH